MKVIECNLRASRSFPFVSKIMKFNFITMATRVMLGRAVESHPKSMFDIDYVGVKSSQFSFARLQNADPVLSVDMTSTGEVACIGDSYYEALLKSLLSVGQSIPKHNVLISSGPARSKVELLSATQMLLKYGFKVYATAGSAEFLAQHGVKDIEVLGWPDEKGAPTVIDYIKQKRIDLVINIPKNQTRRELDNEITRSPRGHRLQHTAADECPLGLVVHHGRMSGRREGSRYPKLGIVLTAVAIVAIVALPRRRRHGRRMRRCKV